MHMFICMYYEIYIVVVHMLSNTVLPIHVSFVVHSKKIKKYLLYVLTKSIHMCYYTTVMAVPKKKSSKARTRRRYHINSVLKIPELYRDKKSGTLVRRHHINAATGMYRGVMYEAPQANDKQSKQITKK